jgi:hypothetical protein
VARIEIQTSIGKHNSRQMRWLPLRKIVIKGWSSSIPTDKERQAEGEVGNS